MNERIHFFTKIYLSHFILERVDVSVVCERWVETGTDCYINPSSSLDHSSTSSTSWLGLLNWGSLRTVALNLQAGLHSGIPVTDLLNGRRHLSIFFHNDHLLPLFFRLFTAVYLLIDVSVEGQYISIENQLISFDYVK